MKLLNPPFHRMILLFALVVFTGPAASETTGTSAERPNILWISIEDMSPLLGCYDDPVAKSPNVDKLAAEGCRYTNAFSVSPVCSASRSAIITGMYNTTIGTHNHRSHVTLPPGVRCFPAYLREAGYFCTNNYKTDYNFDVPKEAWDENGHQAHWRHRPDKSQPFFAVFNITTTHEGKFFMKAKKFAELTKDVSAARRTDPAEVTLPPYIPDTPVTRADRARAYDMVAEMDIQAHRILDELAEDGLASNTVVMFFSDHGIGLPRGKRWLYDSGTRVPLIVRWPGHVKAGSTNDELVSLFDAAPTVLSLAGLQPPANMQARIFMGPHVQPAPPYLFQTRDRMDETYDMIRSVRGPRYRYVRNFHPEKPYDQVIDYAEKNPTLQELRRLHKEGKLAGPATWFFQDRKPVEELYDTQNDPWEIHNLADDPAYADRLNTMRNELTAWQIRTGDKGLEPEPASHRR